MSDDLGLTVELRRHTCLQRKRDRWGHTEEVEVDLGQYMIYVGIDGNPPFRVGYVGDMEDCPVNFIKQLEGDITCEIFSLVIEMLEELGLPNSWRRAYYHQMAWEHARR